MSEIALNQQQAATPASMPTTTGTVQLQEWAAELNAAHQLGTALCGTEFVPKDFRGKPDAAAAAILAGKALGLDPMNALSNIFVVQGRPALYARTMAALVMQAGHEIVRTEATPEAVTVQARRKSAGQWQTFTWTMDRAKTAGYTGNAKYKTNPVEMLYAKAVTEACRVIAPDVLTGVAAYSVEEIELDDLGETVPATDPDPEKPKRKITRKPKNDSKTRAPSPDVPDVVNDAPEDDTTEVEPETDPEANAPADTGEMCSRDQQTALGEALKTAGHTTKADMMRIVSTWAGREVNASKELTAAECVQLTAEIRDSLNTDTTADTATAELWPETQGA